MINNKESRHSFMSEGGKYIYHISIIDYLQDFNFDKSIESKYKSTIGDGTKISAIAP